MKKEFFKKALVIFSIILLNINSLAFATEVIVEGATDNEEELIENEQPEEVTEEVTDLFFENEEESLYVGAELNLNLTIVPDTYEGKVEWTSNDEDVASVDENGKVTAKKAGTVIITATVENGLYAEVEINVKEKTKVSLSETSITLSKGSAKTLTVKFEPAEAKEKVTWSSSNTKVAKVDSNGKVTAVEKGTATITAKTESGETLTCTVNVKLVSSTKLSLGYAHRAKTKSNLIIRKSPSTKSARVYTVPKGERIVILRKVNSDWYNVEYTKGSRKYTGYMAIKYLTKCSNITLPVGKTKQLTAYLTPSNSTDTVKWTTTNSSIVSVSQSGKLTLKKKGKATITAKASSGRSNYVIVEVTEGKPLKSLSLTNSSIYTKVGKPITVGKKISPSNTTEELTWTSSNTSVAKVDSKGKVTPIKEGKTVITLRATSGKSDTCTVYVADKDAMSLNYKAAYVACVHKPCTRIIYGKSSMGNPLEAYEIKGNGKNNKTIFLNFAVHGYEDEYAKDGKVLVTIANHLISYYSINPDKLGDYRMVIVPAANPDGVLSGKNNYRSDKKGAFGRCTAKGIDMNRDFGKNGFKAVESRALRDLMNDYDIDIYFDVHGWENSVIGDRDLVNIVRSKVGLKTDKSGRYGEQYGYIIAYAKNTLKAKSALIEFKDSKSASDIKLRNALNMVMDVF